MRGKLNFNQGWKFIREYIEEAVLPSYDLTKLEVWESVNLPHSLRLEPVDHSGVPTYQGLGMYRKHFALDQTFRNGQIYIEFEAVMGVTDVWVNGVHLQTKLANKTPDETGIEAHTHYGGYLPFVVCLNEVVQFDGTDNVIVVLVDNRDNEQVPPGKPQDLLDFTYFGGIYRNVWMEITEPIHITNPLYEDRVAGGGVCVEYSEVSKERAKIHIHTHIRDERETKEVICLKTVIKDRSGNGIKDILTEVAIQGQSDQTTIQQMIIDNPQLWNIDSPYLYTVESYVLCQDRLIDQIETKIGIRTIEVDRKKGLLINGETAPLLSGVNRHQDYPFIGNAAPSSMQRRDAILLKSAGFNVVRAAHYPMSIDFLKACDELGILLFEATPGWQWYPVERDEPFTARLHNNIRQMVRRDRNHPCILAYEIVLNETYHIPYGYTKRSALVALSEQKEAKIATESYGYDHSENANGIDQEADFIFGFENPLEKTKKAVMFLREYADSWMEYYGYFTSRRVTRGITDGFYPGGEGRNLIKANKMLWDTADGNYSLADRYAYQEENKAFVGCALWTGIDSRGMCSAMSPCGIWDGFRIPKFSYYAFESQRSPQKVEYLESLGVKTGPMLFIASNWTAKCPVVHKVKDIEPIKEIGTDEQREIFVYSNVDKVILTVEKNGERIWEEEGIPIAVHLPYPPFKFTKVPYIQGSTLKAVGYNHQGEVIARQEIRTAAAPKKIKLTAQDYEIPLVADGSDMVLVYGTVLDEEGNICSEATNSIYFTIEGEATIVGDGDRLACTNPFKAEAGIAAVYVKASMTTGKIKLIATSYELEKGEVEIEVKKAEVACAPYTEIKQIGTLETASMNLSSKKVLGECEKDQLVVINGERYPNSIIFEKDRETNGQLIYFINGSYTQLTSGFARIEGDEKAELQISLDGILRYQVSLKETEEINLEISGTQKLEFNIKSEGTVKVALLSPYFLQEETGMDQSELHQNLALCKKATANINAEDAFKVLEDEDVWETIWMGTPLKNEESQFWQVDLGEAYSIRNAKVYIGGQMGSDCTHYTYLIETSSDGEYWIKQAQNKRTSWSNGVLDRFVAKDVRYIRVRFVHIDGIMSAAISRFEVYPDYGVDVVEEYNLKGITIEGHDLLFDPKQNIYEIYTSQEVLRVRAIAMDPNATVSINGVVIECPEEGDIFSTYPISIYRVDCNGSITISVVSALGLGRKDYQIIVYRKG